MHLEHMPSKWEGKANPSPWGDLKFGRPVQVKQSSRTYAGEGQRDLRDQMSVKVGLVLSLMERENHAMVLVYEQAPA